MRKNRKITKKMNVMTRTAARFGAIIGVLFVMVIINLLASSSCQQIMKSIGDKEKKLERLEDARSREESRWEAMKTPEKIDSALRRHGLAMRPPRGDQTVYMKADGTPYVGQSSMMAAARRSSGKIVRYRSSSR